MVQPGPARSFFNTNASSTSTRGWVYRSQSTEQPVSSTMSSKIAP
ncbi:hypothetical protein SRABI128_01841 [Microbacterium sp. Bi128]|nr:hypothetical protein SRABI128_01841 [Microbacterium sp. Bi128]